LLIREEQSGDQEAVRLVIAEAFKAHPHSSQREHHLVDALRDAGVMTLALVAEENGEVVGHVAFSPVRIGGLHEGWYGLGPVAVRPDRQRRGIGTALIREGLERLKNLQAAGCVLLGEPAYYGRFGFTAYSQLRLEGVPPEFFLALPFNGTVPTGTVEYHPAFWEVG
jgi:putative acetyltransferase